MNIRLHGRLAITLLLPVFGAGCFGDHPYDEAAVKGTLDREPTMGAADATERTACLHPKLRFRAIHPEIGAGFSHDDYEIVVESGDSRRLTLFCSLRTGRFTCTTLENTLPEGESAMASIVPHARAEDSTAKFVVDFTAGGEIPSRVRVSIALGERLVFDLTVSQDVDSNDPCEGPRPGYTADGTVSLEMEGAEPDEISL